MANKQKLLTLVLQFPGSRMKRGISIIFYRNIIVLLLCPFFSLAQLAIGPAHPNYDQLKAEGKIPDNKGRFTKASRLVENPHLQLSQEQNLRLPFFKACKELIPVDSSFLVVPFLAGTLGPPPFYRNDDASTQVIQIPFTFCFYGSSFTSLYINNNGNISFDGPQVTYRPDSLPTTDFMALAPFWSDVDTRNFNSGVVYYKIAPTYMIVTWDHVGYYNSHADKKNTFQLIITDGQDSTFLGPGKNVGFRYDEMQWSTGDIGGNGGFSISYNHATVGANKSDSLHFVQFGRFGVPGDAYDGPYGGTDGVSWLNGRVFEFNACSGTNIEPIVNNFNYCDTVYSCVGDTSFFELSFLSPERNQITSTSITTTATSGLTIQQNTPGEVNKIKARFIGEFANVGFQHLTFAATDNGISPASTLLDIVIKVEQLNAPFSIAGGGVNICPGTTIPLTATVGFEKYKWSNNATGNPIYATSGDYFVTGKMGKCYLQSDTVHVGSIPVTIPIIQGNSSTQLCPEDSTLLTVSNNFPYYIWSNGDTSKSSYQLPGNPYVTIVDTNGCEVQSTPFTVPQFPMKPLLISGVAQVCPGDSLLLTASSGFVSYLWNSGAMSTSVTVPSGVYSVSVVDSNSCKLTSVPKLVSEFEVIPPSIIGNKGYCLGDSTQLSVSPNYLNYLWNTADTLSQVYVQQGAYSVAVIDMHQCAASSDTFVVNQFSVTPLVINGMLKYCPSDSALLVASPGFTHYYWNLGQRADSIYVQNGNYAVSAVDSNGCESYSTAVEVNPHSISIPQISGNMFACPNDSALLQANLGFVSYLWSAGDTGVSVLLPAGNYTVQVIDSNGCSSESVVVQVQNYSVQIPLVSGNAICCSNDSTLLTADAGFVQYLWSSGNTSSSALLPPGTYYVEVHDSNTCKTTSSNFTINAYPTSLPILSGHSFYCKDDSTLLSISPAFSQYQWSNGNTQQFCYVQSGVYHALIRDTNNCTFRTNDMMVQQHPVQVPPILGKNYVCAGDSILLQTTSFFTQPLWSTGATSSSISVPKGNYLLTAKDSNNCTSFSAPFAVNWSLPIAQIIGPQTNCGTDSALLFLNPGFTSYNWNTGSQEASIYATSGIYSVQVLDSIGCKATDSIEIVHSNLPTAYFTTQTSIPEVNEVVQFFDASQGNGALITGYSWSFQNGNVLSGNKNLGYTFTDTGTYILVLTVTSEFGCSDSYMDTIRPQKTLRIPNIITPNGDGNNDVFEIVNLNLNEDNSFHVFDRWGKLVFGSNKYQNEWDALEVKDGVYFYSLRIFGQKEIKGAVTIVR